MYPPEEIDDSSRKIRERAEQLYLFLQIGNGGLHGRNISFGIFIFFRQGFHFVFQSFGLFFQRIVFRLFGHR